MSRANYDSMSNSQGQEYAKNKTSMNLAQDYFGPRGPLFCGVTPGVCSSSHCPLRKP